MRPRPLFFDTGGDLLDEVIVDGWVKSLRRRLGVRPSPQQIRDQTRERVRRWRTAQKG